MKAISASDYLDVLKATGHSPNFCCSGEWFEKDGWKAYADDDGRIHIVDGEGLAMLPTIIPTTTGRPVLSTRDSYDIGFSSFRPTPNVGESLRYWDHEFIYDPKAFTDLSGGKWKDVRKNLRWAVEDLGEDVHIEDFKGTSETELDKLLEGWKPSDEAPVFAPETLVTYALTGANRIVLRGVKSGRLLAILIWDENWKYINFRYCLTIGGVRGLSDTARVAFYRWVAFWTAKLVNDGGSLGRTGLFRYKSRLNPAAVNTVYGWTAKEDK
jgi:hypothetical protein